MNQNAGLWALAAPKEYGGGGLGTFANCVVLEDALKGLDAAKQAGMACIIVRNKLNMNIDFPGADLIVSNLGEVISLLGN